MRRTGHPIDAGGSDRRRLAGRPTRPGRLAWLGAGAVLVAVGAGWYLLPVSAWLAGLRDWVVALGLTGVVLFVAIYVVATVLLAPVSLMTIAAGFAYGFWALPVVLVAATTGASLAFLAARYVARDRVRRLLGTRSDIAAIDKAIAAEGWKIVALSRLSPLIPFSLQNYLFGVTAVPFVRYAAASFAGIIPGTTLYVYVGALGGTAGGGPVAWGFFGAGLLATIVVVVLVTRKARGQLREAGLDTPPARGRQETRPTVHR